MKQILVICASIVKLKEMQVLKVSERKVTLGDDAQLGILFDVS